MEVYTRRFRKDVYDEVDAPSKKALIKYLESEGHTITRTKENYYADVVSEKDGVTYFHEAERKAQWNGDWPTHWEEIRIPGRKRRLVEKYKNVINNLYFFIFNKDYTQAWKIKGSQMVDDNIKEASGPVYRIPKGETFYHIPYQEAELVDIV
tara:strand:- start:157 stop:612 length:456 start_codon:yes stop_codon:yes gene_type:complete